MRFLRRHLPGVVVRFLYDQLAEALSTVAGIRLHQGKTRVWNTIGQCPEDNADLGPKVWSIDGIMVFWGAQSSSRRSWRKESGRNKGYGRPSHLSRTNNVLGRFCCRAQVHAQIIPSEQCRPVYQRSTLEAILAQAILAQALDTFARVSFASL